MRNERSAAQLDLRCHGSHARQRDEGIDERVIRALHAVGMKHQVVADEKGIEAERFRFLRSLNQFFLTRFRTKMRAQKTVLCSHSIQILSLRDQAGTTAGAVWRRAACSAVNGLAFSPRPGSPTSLPSSNTKFPRTMAG